jgi:hypothetical protein
MNLRALAPQPRSLAALVVFVALGAIGFLPLFGGPGYEQSLASGLVVPTAAAIAAAVELSAVSHVAPAWAAARGVGIGALLAGVAFATALLHGLRVGICDFRGGATFFVLTAGFGAALGGLWGAVVAEWARGRKRRKAWCIALGLAAPLAGIVASVVRFFTSPMIFSYDPFFGFFSGTLYDTIVDVRPELWTYRAGSLATIAGAVLAASAMLRTAQGTVAVQPLRRKAPVVVRLALGVALLIASLGSWLSGPALGHWQTASSIAAALGARAHGARCDVVYPESLLADQAALLVRDCEQQLAADEQRLGASLPGRLTEFVFKDADQKRALMGAAQTSIAKPWRREVYVQMAGFPHPILGHEIAHVVSGTFGRGPFRIAGGAGGLWPNPGLIEGIAVATSPDDDELTGAQWARAMLDLGLLPSLERLFSLGFLGENASKSYTVAGAFVTWVRDRWGPGVVRAWYGGAPLPMLTGLSWGDLDRSFRESLLALAMPPDASAYAKAKFERPSVWARRCPHVVDALDHEADRCRDEHRFARATSLYDDALARDPHDWHARFDRARIETWYGNGPRGREELRAIADDDQAPRNWRDRAQEALADDDLANGRAAPAVAAYRALAGRTLDEDVARTLEVKAMASDNPPARRAIVDLLVGSPGRPVDAWQGALSLGLWAEETRSVLAAYLVGKNLLLHEEYVRAAAWLDRAIEDGAPSARVGRELLRQRAIAACALGDAPALAHVKELTQDDKSPFGKSAGGGRREWVLRLIARCGQGVQNR